MNGRRGEKMHSPRKFTFPWQPGSFVLAMFLFLFETNTLNSFDSLPYRYEYSVHVPCLRLVGGGRHRSLPRNRSSNSDSPINPAAKEVDTVLPATHKRKSPRTKAKEKVAVDGKHDGHDIPITSAAAKMMSKMGWAPNKGLGKNMSGMVHPLSLNENKNKAGIGSTSIGDLMADGANAFAQLSQSVFNMSAWRQAGQKDGANRYGSEPPLSEYDMHSLSGPEENRSSTTVISHSKALQILIACNYKARLQQIDVRESPRERSDREA
jgi:hypothetical protein